MSVAGIFFISNLPLTVLQKYFYNEHAHASTLKKELKLNKCFVYGVRVLGKAEKQSVLGISSHLPAALQGQVRRREEAL